MVFNWQSTCLVQHKALEKWLLGRDPEEVFHSQFVMRNNNNQSIPEITNVKLFDVTSEKDSVVYMRKNKYYRQRINSVGKGRLIQDLEFLESLFIFQVLGLCSLNLPLQLMRPCKNRPPVALIIIVIIFINIITNLATLYPVPVIERRG